MVKQWRKMTIIFLAAGGIAFFTGEIQAAPQNGSGNNLESALQATMTLHPGVKSKLAELASLGFKVEAAEASRLPSIGLVTQAMSGTNYNGLVRVQQPLWSFGKIKGRVAVADRRTEVGRMELLLAQRHLMEETADTSAVVRGRTTISGLLGGVSGTGDES